MKTATNSVKAYIITITQTQLSFLRKRYDVSRILITQTRDAKRTDFHCIFQC